MNYVCECCSYKCMYPKDFEKHKLTNKHQKNMNKQEIKCEGCLQKDVMIERLQQEINELRSKYDSLVDKIVLQSFQPAVQSVQVQPVPVQSAVKKRERINEEYLIENCTTTIVEFLKQVNYDDDEEELCDLVKQSDNFEYTLKKYDALVLKKLKEIVDSTDYRNRGFVTTDLKRRNMWILRKDKWEVDTKATVYIKKTLRFKINMFLGEFYSSENEHYQDTALSLVQSAGNEKWEDMDTKIMEMFVFES